MGSNHTCPPQPSLTDTAQQNLFGDISFRHFAMIVAGSCTGLSCVIVLALMARHATHYSKTREQAKILKICLLIPLYSILSFLALCFPNIYVYTDVWFSYFEAIAFATFFLLLCEYISERNSERELFFAALVIKDKKNHQVTGPGSVEWYRKQWLLVFQYPVVALGVAIATVVTQGLGIYCMDTTGASPTQFASFWLGLIPNFSVSIAVYAIVKFYLALKPYIANQRPLSKLIAFKIIVGLAFIEQIIFLILKSVHVLKPTTTLTYADVNIGIPTLIICIQNVPLAVLFHYAYTCTPYILSTERPAAGGPIYHGGFCGWKAWPAVINPGEVFRGLLFAFKMHSLVQEHYHAPLPSETDVSRMDSYPLYPYGEQNPHAAGPEA